MEHTQPTNNQDYQNIINQINDNKALIDSRRPLTPEEAKELDAYFRIGMTYSSNALEGSTLTLTETKVLLEDGITAGGKTIRECNEAIGHGRAYDYMLSVARSQPFTFSEDMILQLHKLFYSGIDEAQAGRYRDRQVFISGTEYLPPTAGEVPAQMAALVAELNGKREALHPVTLAAFAHRRLVDIHPFTDGNGRTARLLMNLVLVHSGYPVVSIPPILRLDYIRALQAAHREDNPSDEAFVALIAECVLEALRDYKRLLRIKPPQKDAPAR